MTTKPIVTPTIIITADYTFLPNTFNALKSEATVPVTVTMVDFNLNLLYLYIDFYNNGTDNLYIYMPDTTQTFTLLPGNYMKLSTNLNIISTGSTAPIDSWNINGNTLTTDGVIGSASDHNVYFIRNSVRYLTLRENISLTTVPLNCNDNAIINVANPQADKDAVNKLYVDRLASIGYGGIILSPNNMTNNMTPAPFMASASVNITNAYLAFDGNNSTSWVGDGWISLDFGTEVNVQALQIIATNITAFTFAGSDDNILFTNVFTAAYTTQTYGFFNPYVFRYYRLTTQGTGVSISTLSMLTGGVDMHYQIIYNLSDPVAAHDAVNKQYMETNALLVSGSNQMLANLQMGNNRVENLANPINPQDAVTKSYLDALRITEPLVVTPDPLNYGFMTWNDIPIPFVANASTSPTLAYKAFDGLPTSSWQPTTPTGWLSIDLGFPYAISLFRIISDSNGTITLWSLQGSLNNITFLDLYIGAVPLTTTIQEFALTNTSMFRYYRLNILTSSSIAGITEWSMYINIINANNQKIVNVADPTSSQDAATKNYVDTSCLLVDGSNMMNADLNVNDHNIINLATPVLNTDAVNKEYVDTTTLLISGSNPMVGNLNMNMFSINNLAAPILPDDAVTKQYIDDLVPLVYADTIVSPENMTSNTTPIPYVVTTSANPIGPGFQAFDGNINTSWISNGGWLQIYLGTSYRVEALAVRGSADPQVTGPITKWNIQGSNNGSSFITIFESDATIPSSSNAKYTFICDVSYSYFKFNVVSGGTVIGLSRLAYSLAAIDMRGRQIINMANPAHSQDATTKSYCDGTFLNINGTPSMIGSLDMSNNRITNVATPIANTDAVTKEYVDTFGGATAGLIPIMTSNNTPQPFMVDANGTQLSSYPYFAFDQDDATTWNSTMLNNAYLSVDMGIPLLATVVSITPKIHSGYIITEWELIGSNNDFITPGVVLFQSYTIISSGNTGTYSFVNNIAYRYYKFLFIASQGDFTTGLVSAQLYQHKIIDAQYSIISNVLDPIAPNDAVTKNYVDNNTLLVNGNNYMKAILNVGGNRIINVGEPINTTDATTKEYVDNITSTYQCLAMPSSDWVRLYQINGNVGSSMNVTFTFVKLDGAGNFDVNMLITRGNNEYTVVTYPWAGESQPNIAISYTEIWAKRIYGLATSNMYSTLFLFDKFGNTNITVDGITTSINDPDFVLNLTASGLYFYPGVNIDNVANPITNSQAANKAYVDSVIPSSGSFLKTDGTNKMLAPLNVGNNGVINLTPPLASTDGVNRTYADSVFPLTAGSIIYTPDISNTGFMTSNNTPAPFVASDSDTSNNSYLCFDGNSSTGWSTNLLDSWVKIYLGSACVVNSISITAYGLSIITKWQLSGSNDGISWSPIFIGTPTEYGTTSLSVRFTNNIAYSWYTVTILDATLNGLTGFNKIVLQNANYNANNRIISNLGTPVATTDAATLGWTQSWVGTYLPTKALLRDGTNTMTASFNINNNRIINLPEPTYPSDATTKTYVDALARSSLTYIYGGTIVTPTNMTSNTMPIPFVASATENNSSAYMPFDGNNSTFWNVILSTSGTLTIDLGAVSQPVHCMRVVPIGTLLTWTLEGSLDNLVYVNLYVGGTLTTSSDIIITTIGGYRYYRISILTSTGNAGFRTIELTTGVIDAGNHIITNVVDPVGNDDAVNYQFMEKYVDSVIEPLDLTPNYLVPIMTSNTTPIPFVVSATSGINPYVVFDRAISTSWTPSIIPATLRVTLNTAAICTSFMVTGNLVTQWSLSGSTDNITYNNLYNGTSVSTDIINIVNNTAYQYYALNITAGNGSISVFNLFGNSISVNNRRIANVSTPTTTTDAVNKAYADLFLPLSGGTMSGIINMNFNSLTNLVYPTASGDATSQAYVSSFVDSKVNPLTDVIKVGYLVPIMTSNMTPAPYVARGDDFSTNAYNVFDRSILTSWQHMDNSDGWVDIKLTAATVCTYFEIQSSSNWYNTWAFGGSQDGITYTTLYVSGSRVPSTLTCYTISPSIYLYYRFAGFNGTGVHPGLIMLNLFGSQIDFSGCRLTNIALPIAGTDAVNKTYVDAIGGVSNIILTLSDPGSTTTGSLWPITSIDYVTNGFTPAALPNYLLFSNAFIGGNVRVTLTLYSRGATTFQALIWLSPNNISGNVVAVNQTSMVLSAYPTTVQCTAVYLVRNITNTTAIAFGPDLFTSVSNGTCTIELI